MSPHLPKTIVSGRSVDVDDQVRDTPTNDQPKSLPKPKRTRTSAVPFWGSADGTLLPALDPGSPHVGCNEGDGGSPDDYRCDHAYPRDCDSDRMQSEGAQRHTDDGERERGT